MFKQRKHALAVWAPMFVSGVAVSACGGGGFVGGGAPSATVTDPWVTDVAR